MKKKKVISLLMGMCLFILFLLVYFKPLPLISLPYTISNDHSIHSKNDISISSISFNGENITDRVDKEALIEILSKFTCRRTLSKPSSYFIKDAWEINLVQGSRPLHIVLGEIAFSYSFGNSVRCKIIDSESLTQALNNMTNMDMECYDNTLT